MNGFEEYPFWDLIAEEAYKPTDKTLLEGTYEKFYALEKEKEIYIFGCNDACMLFVKEFCSVFHFVGILDNAEEKWGSTWCGLPVFNPAELAPSLKGAAVIIALRLNADDAAGQLKQLGFSDYYSLGVLIAGLSPYKEAAERMEQIKRQPLEDIVMLESTNDFDGNAGALYEYLRANGSAHRFIWVVKREESKKYVLDRRDKAVCPRAGRKDMEEYIVYRTRARWQIWDSYQIRKVRADQINVFLQHFGMGYKMVAGLYRCPSYVDYVLTTTEEVYACEKDSLLYPASARILYGELPRNDVLFSRGWDELSKITGHTYQKVVMWAPTLRESAVYRRIDSDLEYPYGVSLLYKEEDIGALNGFLAQRDMLLLIKIHPRQKLNYTDKRYSNILYLDAVTVKKVHAYKLLTQIDAMITDYSSIVFDYMLLDRPIAWVLEDMGHYKVPFLMENPLAFMPGNHIYTLAQLYRFLEQIYAGEDPYREQRNALSQKYNAPKEGQGCENIARILGL